MTGRLLKVKPLNVLVSTRTIQFNSIFMHLPPHCIYVVRVILYSEEPLNPFTARTNLASASSLSLFTLMLPNKTGRRLREACPTWLDNSQFQTAFSTWNWLHAFVSTNDDTDVVYFILIILKWICPMPCKQKHLSKTRVLVNVSLLL